MAKGKQVTFGCTEKISTVQVAQKHIRPVRVDIPNVLPLVFVSEHAIVTLATTTGP